MTAPDTVATADTARADVPRGALRLMVDPVFGVIMWGKLFASSGAWMHLVVAAVIVYDATGSALLVGMVSMAQFGPQLLLSLVAGAWADRGYAYRQIVLGRAATAVASGGLGAWFVWQGEDGGRYGVAAVLVATVLMGTGFAVAAPAMHSVVPSLIRPGELPVAMALNSAPLTFSLVIGPVLGSYVAAHLGAAAAFGIAGFIHLLFVVMMMLVGLPQQARLRAGEDSSIRTALAHVWRDRPLLALLTGIAGVGLAAEPTITLAPALVSELGEASGVVGVITGSFGGGAALSLMLFGVLNKWVTTPRLASSGVVLMAAGLAVVGSFLTIETSIAGFFCCGFGFTLVLTGMSALVQERAPGHLRGRIMAVWVMAVLGSRPLAAAVEGFVADTWSVRIAILCPLVALAAVFVSTRPSRLSR